MSVPSAMGVGENGPFLEFEEDLGGRYESGRSLPFRFDVSYERSIPGRWPWSSPVKKTIYRYVVDHAEVPSSE